MESFKQFYSRMNGYKITKPKTTYYFVISGTKSTLKDNKGNPISRDAYSPAQAVRFLKRAYSVYLYKDIDAIEELPSDAKLQVVPRGKPKPSEQLGLNI